MNTATDSTRQRPGATQTYLDMLDTLDTADQFLLAIQLISPTADATGSVLDTLATAARQQNQVLRALLNDGLSLAGGHL